MAAKTPMQKARYSRQATASRSPRATWRSSIATHLFATGRLATLAAVLSVVAALMSFASVSPTLAATPAPAWSIHSVAGPTNFVPGDISGFEGYKLYVTNIGGQPTDGSPVTITDTLPAGVTLGGTDTGGGIYTSGTRNYESQVHPECTEKAPSVVQCTYSCL